MPESEAWRKRAGKRGLSAPFALRALICFSTPTTIRWSGVCPISKRRKNIKTFKACSKWGTCNVSFSRSA